MLHSIAPWRTSILSQNHFRRTLPTFVALATRGMAFDTASEKHALRTVLKDSLKRMTEEQMRTESAAIAQQVLSLSAFTQCKHMAVYVHCPRLREVDTSSIVKAALQQDSRVYVPRVQDKDANMHFLHLDTPSALTPVPPFGIMEPLLHYQDGTPREDALEAGAPLQMVVMPGLGFTREGLRLGRGGGYYDKFIEDCLQRAAERGWDPPLLLALSYQAQLVAAVPVQAHDRPVDLLVTADDVIRCSERGRAVR